ncbi:MAG: YARHG domain-containing protein [Treponema sp.]|jgi:hypothetical protein|nr:YARHG domain-containing protein [Treponema sp.]
MKKFIAIAFIIIVCSCNRQGQNTEAHNLVSDIDSSQNSVSYENSTSDPTDKQPAEGNSIVNPAPEPPSLQLKDIIGTWLISIIRGYVELEFSDDGIFYLKEYDENFSLTAENFYPYKLVVDNIILEETGKDNKFGASVNDIVINNIYIIKFSNGALSLNLKHRSTNGTMMQTPLTRRTMEEYLNIRKMYVPFRFIENNSELEYELGIAKQFIDSNALLDSYSVLDLSFNVPDTQTFLFYKPYNNRQVTVSDTVIPFTDGVIIKIGGERIIQYLIINRNGLVKTNDNIAFYDFSESGYSGLRFNGWLYEKSRGAFGIDNPNGFSLQLTNNGINPIAADPPLPLIMWDFELNYPVKYEFVMSPFTYATMLIRYEWREDLKISIARTGLQDERILDYLNKLSAYDKRVTINAMYALYGYEFRTDEWKTYFSKYAWYKPDSRVANSIEILTEYQKRLLEYLSE